MIIDLKRKADRAAFKTVMLKLCNKSVELRKGAKLVAKQASSIYEHAMVAFCNLMEIPASRQLQELLVECASEALSEHYGQLMGYVKKENFMN